MNCYSYCSSRIRGRTVAKYIYKLQVRETMKGIMLILALLILIPAVFAQQKNQVYLVNSKDWRDVYSLLQYGYMVEASPIFMTSESHVETVFNDYQPENVNLTIFSSRSRPWVKNVIPFAKSKGFDPQEEFLDNMNLEFAQQIDTNNFLIIDDAYGYNAVAVAGYAQVAKFFVLFANDENINEIVEFLQSRGDVKLLIYGHVDREVRDALESFNPEVINNNGDRYANNVEILKRYKKISDARQVVLSNGEFIEGQIMSGGEPVVFIGKGAVPTVINNYVSSSNIDVGILIGNDLVSTATTLRRQLGISVFVKYARSARSASGPIAQVEGLDRFLLPVYEPKLKIEKFRYNSLSNQLEVIFVNEAQLAVYFSGTYSVLAGDQEQTVGDTQPLFIDGGKTKVVIYELDPIINKDSISAHAYVIFGESPNSLEWAIDADYAVEVVDVFDKSELIIESVEFHLNSQEFVVSLKNTGEVETYVDTEAIDVLVLDERVNFGAKEVINIKSGKTGKSVIPTTLTLEDLDKNKKIRIRAYYGENEGILPKVIEGEFEYKIVKFDLLSMMPIIIIVLLLLLILAAMTKKKCPSCSKKVNRFSKFCKKCGYKLKG